MPKKRTQQKAAHDTAIRVAESIGEALGRIVNRLESLDADRERAYEQLVALQKRLNEQVARFGRALGRTPPGAQSAKKSRRTAAKSRSGRKSSPARKKARVTCSICGTAGHNARGHAKWQASQGM